MEQLLIILFLAFLMVIGIFVIGPALIGLAIVGGHVLRERMHVAQTGRYGHEAAAAGLETKAEAVAKTELPEEGRELVGRGRKKTK